MADGSQSRTVVPTGTALAADFAAEGGDGPHYLKWFYDHDAIRERRVDSFKARSDDVFVTSYPKSGTYWTTFVLTQMYDDWGVIKLGDRSVVPILDYYYQGYVPPSEDGSMDVYRQARGLFLKSANDFPSPRLLKNHAFPDLMPRSWREAKPRIIYITRNPKDVCVSSYHFMKGFTVANHPNATFHDIRRQFLRGGEGCAWLQHVTQWHKFGADDNVLHVSYEEMKKNLGAVVEKIGEFVGRPLSQDAIDRVVAASSLQEMRKNAWKIMDLDKASLDASVSPVCRKGQVGDWKNYFTPEQSELFDRVLGPKLEKEGVDICYEI